MGEGIINFLSHIAQNLREYVPGEQPQGVHWIKLNTNEFPYSPSPFIQEELKKLSNQYATLRKYPHPLSEPLRSRLATKWNVSPENVLVTNGSDEALMLVVRSLFSEGEVVAFPEITYNLYETILASVGVNAYRVPMMKINKVYQIDLKALEKSKAKGIFLANPNAITGEYIECERLKKIIQHSSKFWIIDEAYIDFSESKAASFLNHCHGKENVIVIQTFSKSYGLAGLRVGYAITANKTLMKTLYQMKDSYNQDYIAIQLACRALEDTTYYQNKIEEIKKQREFLTQTLHRNDFFVFSSQANFILVKPQRETAYRIYQKLKEKKILVRYFQNCLLQDYIRISIGSPSDNKALLQGMGINAVRYP